MTEFDRGGAASFAPELGHLYTYERTLRTTVPAVVAAPTEPPVLPPWSGWVGMDTIVIIADEDGYLTTASGELETYLEAITGDSWTVVTEDVDGVAIRLDIDTLAGYGDEAVRVTTDSAGVHITGQTTMAVRHGAYILLEKLGVRWFFKHSAWEIVPSSLTDLGVLDEIQEPSFFYRWIVTPNTVNTQGNADWSMRNRFLGTAFIALSHNYRSICDTVDWYATHPEYFIGDPPDPGSWQLDPENADVLALSIQYALDELAVGTTEVLRCNDTVDVGAACCSPRDGAGFDPPYDETDYPTLTNWVLHLANETAKGIAAAYPTRYITVLNYYTYADVPTISLEPNLLVFVTNGYNFTGSTNYSRIDGLQNKGAKVGIYDYIDPWYDQHDQPIIAFNRIGWVKTAYGERGAKAYLAEGADGWCGRGGLSYYLTSKLLWDYTLDVDDLLSDFYTKCFGAASTVMEHYFENRDTDSAALVSSFSDLDDAETLAVGDADSLARIRQMQYHSRYVWKWHNVGITELSDADLEAFYTFVCKIRDLYVVHYTYVAADLVTELEDREYTEEQITALQDFTEPTAQEASDWMDEALAEFTGYVTPYIDPRKLTLVGLGNTTADEQDIFYGGTQNILIPSDGNEVVTISAKGEGILQWFDPTGLHIDNQTLEDIGDWETVNFTTTAAGTYILHATYLRPAGSLAYIDVPDRPAAILADSRQTIFTSEESNYDTRTAPIYWSFGSPFYFYFYVPTGTTDFRFGANVRFAQWPATGTITNPNDDTTDFTFDDENWYSEEITFTSPVAGLWKLEISMVATFGQFWFVGIPPLVWHDPEYLLVEA